MVPRRNAPVPLSAVLPSGLSAESENRTGIGCAGVATWEEVARLALALPATSERESRGMRQWRGKDKLFVWERPLRRSDLEALGDAAPDPPILGARVEHLVAKDALLADDPDVYFTTPHFDGYPAVLVRLKRIALDDLEELIVEAWLARAPKRLVDEYLAERGLD